MAISPISPLSIGGTQGVTAVPGTTSQTPVERITGTFADMLASLTESEVQSNALIQQVATGQNVDLHELTIGLETTDIQFRVAMGIRDKLVDAYHEIMRMQV